jgi:ABC-2 type transport system ATP-binding protein
MEIVGSDIIICKL